MPDLHAIIAVTLAGLALSLAPGPSMFYVLSRSVGQNRAAGLASALGLGFGGVLLAVATALGLAALFERLDWLVTVLRYAGSGYLVWLGYSMIRQAQDDARKIMEATDITTDPFWRIFSQGVVTELLNPKTVLFFAFFLPPFANAGMEDGVGLNLQVQLLVLGVLVPLTALPSDLAVAFFGGTLAGLFDHQQALRKYLGLTCGFTLMAIAVSLHF